MLQGTACLAVGTTGLTRYCLGTAALERYCGQCARAIAVQGSNDDSDVPDDTASYLSGMSIGDMAVLAEGVIVVKNELGWEAVTVTGGLNEDE